MIRNFASTMPRLASLFATTMLLTACFSPQRSTAPATETHRGYTLERNVTYTPAQWPAPQRADVYTPEGNGPFPAVVVVHGGGWNSRDRGDMDSISKKLVKRGFVVANIDYRLAPQYLYPAALDDVRAALGWLHLNAARLKLDTQRIGGWGYSAGAHLVSLAATLDSGRPQHLHAVVSGGNPADLPRYPNSPIITKFIGKPYAQAQATWIEASPLRHVSAQSPPMFLYHGSFDKLVGIEHSEAMKSALDQAGVPAELYVVHGLGHIPTFLFGGGAEGKGIEFLERRLKAAAKS